MIRKLVKAAFLAWIAKKVLARASAHANRSVAQQVSLSVGVAIGALTLESSMRLRGASGLAVEDFTWAFLTVAGVSALSLLAFIRLPPDAGAEVSRHKSKKRVAPDPVSNMQDRGRELRPLPRV